MSEEQNSPASLSKVEGQSCPESPDSDDTNLKGVSMPPPQVMAWMAQITQKFGPDPETTKILSENECHAEDNRLKAYQANLDRQDRQSQRDQDYRIAQLKQAERERYIVLFSSLAALAIGVVLSLKGNSSLGTPIMVAALTVLSVLVSGKIKIGS